MSHEVVLRWPGGREERLSAEPDVTILEAAEAAGLAPPFGCRTGACTTCTAQLLDGRVEHTRPARGLKRRHREDDYVLTCIAQPRDDCRLRVGVQDELTANPWGKRDSSGEG